MGAAIILMHVMAVIGGNGADAGAFGDPQHVGNNLALLIESVIVDLEKEAALAEDVLVVRRRALGELGPAGQKVGGHLAIETCGQADESFAVLAEQLFVDARLVIKAFQIAFRYKLYEVLITALVFAQNTHVMLPAVSRIAIQTAGFCDVHLTA